MPLTYDVPKGMNVWDAAVAVLALANARHERVEAEFNGTPLVAEPGWECSAVLGEWEARRAEAQARRGQIAAQLMDQAVTAGLTALHLRLEHLDGKAVDSTQKTAVARARVLLADLRIALSAATLLVEPKSEDDDE